MNDLTRWLHDIDDLLYGTRYAHSALAFGIARGWLWPLFHAHDIEGCLPYQGGI